MKGVVKTIIIISTLLISFIALGYNYNVSDGSPLPSRYYVEVKSEKDAQSIAESLNAILISYSEGVAVLQINKPAFEILNSIITGKDIYEETENVGKYTIYQDDICDPDKSDVVPPETNEDYIYNEDSYKEISWINTYKNNITGRGVIVAVLDSGCQISHEDLNTQIVGTYNAVDGSTNVKDDTGHGTHVAGIIAAKDNSKGIVGVAPDAKLYIMKVRSSDGYMWHSNIIRALNRCVELGNISIVNMSLGGGGYSQPFKDAMQNCMNHGILCVTSAGNNSSSLPHYPAAYKVGLSVASCVSGTSQMSSFSNYGYNYNIVAPGSDIYSTFNNGKYKYLSGTSMSAPYVSGIAALVYSSKSIPKNSSGSSYVKNLIISTANNKQYSYNGNSVTGCVNAQNIFQQSKISQPSKPIIKVNLQKSTKQQIVTITSKDNGDIYYTLDGKEPSKNSTKYTGKIHIDTKGTTKLKAVVIKKNSYSYSVTKKIIVENGVISQKRLKNVEIYINDKGTTKVSAGKSVQLKIKDGTKNPLNSSKFKWTSNNTKIATVDNNGKITINAKAKKGKKVKISAKLGNVTKYIEITIK